ncbi:unnamed protein product, partial [Tetraodon nigroviridis]
EGSVSPTEVKMSQIVLPCHCNHQQELCVGQLLKWIDITACLSAERHALCPCVTASMDDIHFDHTTSKVVSITAKVNRAFNSSMEVGVQVSCEDLFSGRRWKVCHAYATFVTQRKETGGRSAGSSVEKRLGVVQEVQALSDAPAQVTLKPVDPQTQQEQLEHSLAAERRRVRMLHDDIIKDLLTYGCIQQGTSVECANAVAAERTRVESVELVLPPHTNHQVNTFGGQIMAWMVNVATIAASRLCQTHPTLRTIDMFTFRGPSQIGDRLLLKAIVNNAFTNSIEVGVRAEAYHDQEPNRHINSAFMIFEVLDDLGKPCTLPGLRPEPLEGERRFQEAIARKKIRLDRKYIISRKQCEVPLSVPWNPRNQASQVYLSYNNVSALKTLASQKKWRLSSEKDKVRLYSLEQKAMLSFRVDTEVDAPAETAFSLLAELRNRPSWDTFYQKCELIHRVDDDDFLYHVVNAFGAPQRTRFPVFGQTRRRGPSGLRLTGVQEETVWDSYVIALRSVSLTSHPPTEGRNRGEVLCAGFTIQ